MLMIRSINDTLVPTRFAALAALTLATTACGASYDAAGSEPEELAGEASAPLTVTFDPRKSLLITDFDVVDTFSLEEVLNQLSDGNALALFQQMFAHESQAGCTSSINGWPAECPRPEGLEAGRNPFDEPDSSRAYKAITLSNRFDLAPANGANCGEYRINFARRSGNSLSGSMTRLFIAFEARLPNPTPSLGLAGCKPVVELWRDLSTYTPVVRAQKLRQLYLDGYAGFAPVIDKHHFGFGGGPQDGQVRVNQFLFIESEIGDWSAREFLLQETTPGQFQFVASFNKDVPARPLFNPFPADARATDFQQTYFPDQVERLALQDLNTMNYATPVTDLYNSGDSHMAGGANPFTELFNDYGQELGSGPSAFRARIQQKLNEIGSSLTPSQIVERATSLSCGGCHNISQDKSQALGFATPFPRSLGFTQVSEDLTPIPGEPTRQRYVTSAFLEQALVYRAQIMRDFLAPVRGFERDGGWSSSQGAVTLSTSIKSEGTASLRVVPTQGWTELVSIPTSVVGSGAIGSTLKLDVRLPTQQPNPYFRGQVGVLISIPSASITDLYLGQASLDSATLGQFSTVSVPLPAKVRRLLGYGVADVKLKVQLNVSPNTNAYYLDNIRF
jgi:hypothetical protein